MKRKRRSSNLFLCVRRHPFVRLCHLTPQMLIPVVAPVLVLAGLVPPGGVAPLRAARAGFAGAAENSQDKKASRQKDLLLFGTVFTEQGFVLPGAEIRVRRAGKRKTRWEARSDGRGEFAVHVPHGAEYEMTVRAAGYQERTQKIAAKSGSRADLVFRLSPAPGRKAK